MPNSKKKRHDQSDIFQQEAEQKTKSEMTSEPLQSLFSQVTASLALKISKKDYRIRTDIQTQGI